MLTKEPKGRDVNDADTFAFNAGFTAQVWPCMHPLMRTSADDMDIFW